MRVCRPACLLAAVPAAPSKGLLLTRQSVTVQNTAATNRAKNMCAMWGIARQSADSRTCTLQSLNKHGLLRSAGHLDMTTSIHCATIHATLQREQLSVMVPLASKCKATHAEHVLQHMMQDLRPPILTVRCPVHMHGRPYVAPVAGKQKHDVVQHSHPEQAVHHKRHQLHSGHHPAAMRVKGVV